MRSASALGAVALNDFGEGTGTKVEIALDRQTERAPGGLEGSDVLIVDDWAMAPMNEVERRDFLEVCDDRYQCRSTILTSQLPVAKWHAQIGDPTLADSILDRLVHNAHRIELEGESLRKTRARNTASDEELQS